MAAKKIIDIEIEGFEEVNKRLLLLPDKVAAKAVKRAARPPARLIMHDALARVNRLSGALAKTIKVRAAKNAKGGKGRRRKKVIGASVISGNSLYTGKSWYGGPVHYGHRVVNKSGDTGKRVEGNPYLDDALKSKRRSATRMFEALLMHEIDTEVVKLGGTRK